MLKKIVESIFRNPFFKDQVQINSISVQLHKRLFVISVFWRIKYSLLCQKHHWSIHFSKVCYSNLLRGHSIATLARRGVGGVNRKSMEGHVTKNRSSIKCSFLSTRGGGGQNWVKFGPRSYWMSSKDTCKLWE